jgi:hypothetical protein
MDTYVFKTKQWIQVALINFCIVALAGVTLRYKINFSLRAVNQKYLLYAHSHFAFDGWVTLALMALMVFYLQKNKVVTNYKKYHWILLANCLVSYAGFIAFIIEGYGFYAISVSIITILVSYFFIYFLWRDLHSVEDKSYAINWIKGGLILWGLSSLGAFALAYLMANKIMVQDYYFAAVYFFLHFQYNGWFLFVCFGLLFYYLYSKEFFSVSAISKKLFFIMALTVVPTYFLSILWLKLPKGLHLLADISGILQLFVLIYFIGIFPKVKKSIPNKMAKTTRYLWIMASIAFILKIVLQMLSIIPYLSNFAFGFRPVVIGYLHLSFLGIISFFILGFFNEIMRAAQHRINGGGIIIFVIGFLVQEIILMLQGLEAMEVTPIPYAAILLLVCAIFMAIGIIWITVGVSKKRSEI